MEQDLADVKDYQVIRLYATNCSQVANVIQATKGSVSTLTGIYDVHEVENEVGIITSAINANWKRINTVSVGNELVNSGSASVGDVISAIGVPSKSKARADQLSRLK